VPPIIDAGQNPRNRLGRLEPAVGHLLVAAIHVPRGDLRYELQDRVLRLLARVTARYREGIAYRPVAAQFGRLFSIQMSLV
jgi:hypothetical protein